MGDQPDRYVFSGDQPALDDALAALGVEPGAANRVRALYPYRVLMSLLSQACHGEPEHAPGIVAEAEKHLATLHTAVRAAEETLAAAKSGLGLVDHVVDADGQADTSGAPPTPPTIPHTTRH